MATKKDRVPVKIAILLFFGVVIILCSGYLSYRSISSIVKLIYIETKPTYGMATIREISSNIERSENYVRIYGLTKKSNYLYGYRSVAKNIDAGIDSLYKQYPDDEWFIHKIDTIQVLFDAKKRIWNEMVSIWQYDTTDNVISELAKEYQPVAQDTVIAEVGFIKNLFTRKKEEEPAPPIENDKILEKIVDLDKTEKETGRKLQKKENELSESSNLLNEAFLSLTGQLEAYEKRLDLERYQRAGDLADKTTLLIAIFSLTATLLSIVVLFVIIKYARKNREYNNVLIKSRQETENLSKAKELFMANVSHEIRTPLNAITGFIDQIMDAPLERKVQRKLNIVKAASKQLLRLINDVLDFSKLQAGKLTLQNQHFDPENLIKDICTVFSASAKKNRNALKYRITGDNQILFGDSLRFQQILYNLLSNAIKFTQDGEVLIRLLITPSANSKAFVKLTVKDTGLGIESTKIDKIFQDFTQEDQEVAIKYGGTGLGLSIVKELVELFNGNVSIKSKKGFGTTVTCDLVLQLGDVSKISVPALPVKKVGVPKGMHFLVADDEEYNRLLIATILEKWNAKYDMVTNGVDTIEKLRSNTYDCVLTDVRMPEIDGIMVTKFIRDTLQLSKDKLSVIGITADISGRITDESKALFNAFLIKPFTEEELLQALTSTDVKLLPEVSEPPGKTDANGTNGDLSNLLRTAGDDLKFVEEMLIQFDTSTKLGLADMQAAIEQNEFSAVRDLAHKLASPSRHLGTQTLLKQLKEIENHAESQNKAAVIAVLGQANQSAITASEHLFSQLNEIK